MTKQELTYNDLMQIIGDKEVSLVMANSQLAAALRTIELQKTSIAALTADLEAKQSDNTAPKKENG